MTCIFVVCLANLFVYVDQCRAGVRHEGETMKRLSVGSGIG